MPSTKKTRLPRVRDVARETNQIQKSLKFEDEKVTDTLVINTTLEALLRHLETDPMLALERCKVGYTQSTKSHNERLYDFIAFLCAYVEKIRNNDKEREKLWSSDLWTKPLREPTEGNVPRAAARFMLEAGEARGSRYEQARTYGRIVQYFCSSGVAPLEVPAKLKRLGIYKVIDDIDVADDALENMSPTDKTQAEKETTKPAKTKTARSDDFKSGSRETTPPAVDGDDNDNDNDNDEHLNPDVKPTRTRSVRLFDPAKDIAIDAGEFFDTILTLEQGDRCLLQILCTDIDPPRFIVDDCSMT